MRIPYRIRIRYGYARDTARIRIHAVSAYPSLIGPETHDWKCLSPIIGYDLRERRAPRPTGERRGVDGRRRPDARRRGRQAAAVEPEVDRAEGWRRPDARRGGRVGEEGAALAGRESHGEGRIAARRCSPRRCDLSQHASTITHWRTPALRPPDHANAACLPAGDASSAASPAALARRPHRSSSATLLAAPAHHPCCSISPELAPLWPRLPCASGQR